MIIMDGEYHKKQDYSRFRPIGYPVRHRRKVPFEPSLSLDIRYRGIIRRIRELDRELDGFVLSATDYLDLISETFSDNIHWTTRIEGNDLSLDEVRRLTTRFTSRERIETRNGPSQEILNHLYSLFAKKEFGLPWNISNLENTHRMLMEGVHDDIVPGKIRDSDVSVIGHDGTEYFIACPPAGIKAELESLLDWLNTSPYDELITATVFFHEFESIHPFRDGNGSTGRTLFQILLQELGLKNCKLCKFEKEMLSDSSTYYNLMAYTDSAGIYSQLVMYVAESLLEAYEKAVDTFGTRDLLKGMDENSRLIVQRARNTKSFTFNDAVQWIPGLGVQSLRMYLDRLTEMGILEKRGRTKGLRYSFNDPLRELRYSLSAKESGTEMIDRSDRL